MPLHCTVYSGPWLISRKKGTIETQSAIFAVLKCNLPVDNLKGGCRARSAAATPGPATASAEALPSARAVPAGAIGVIGGRRRRWNVRREDGGVLAGSDRREARVGADRERGEQEGDRDEAA